MTVRMGRAGGGEYVQAVDAPPQPTPDEIEDRFDALIEGRSTREEIDRWAAWWTAKDELDWDGLSWWALTLLHGIDLPAGEGGDYLHNEDQIRTWLAELRKGRA